MKLSFRSRALLFFAVTFLFFHQNILAQTVSVELPDDFFACGTGQFEITVSNNSASTISNVELTYDFSTSSGLDCGVVYFVGTVVGASEANLSDLGAPVFGISNLAAGETATFTFEAEAPCSVVECIDGAEVFSDEISLNWAGGNTAITTDPYVIERALLVITSVEESLLSGSQGDVLERKITIVNSRPGALQSFLFSDNHQGGIEISTDLGTVVGSTATNFQIALDGNDFATIGNGNGLFELNETIVITESILITDCGVDIPSTVSTLTAGWGCGGEICQEVSANGIVTIDESDREPILVFEPITSVSECFCGPDGYTQGLEISNIGDGPALNIWVSIFRQFPINFYLIDSASIRVDSAGMPLPVQPSNLPNSTSFDAPCDGPESMVDYFQFLFPELGPGESMTIFFDAYFCEMECPQPQIDWWYDFSFFKPCPPDPFVELDFPIQVMETGNSMVVDLLPGVGYLMEDDSIYTVTYELTYDSLTQLSDTVFLQFILPCGMQWVNDNDLILDGQSPIDYEVVEGDTFTVVTASYLLPFSSNVVTTDFDFTFDCESLCLDEQICEDSLATSCPAIDTCISYPPPTLLLNSITTIQKCPDYPLSCNPQYCTVWGSAYDCPIDSICINEPPGYVNFEYVAARKNYGLADDDNDRIPDGTGGANLDLVSRNRFIAGDTIRAEMRGEVAIDFTGTTLPYGNIFFDFSAGDLGLVNIQNLLTDGPGIHEAGSLIRIFDASSGEYFECPNPTPIVDDDGAALSYLYDLSSDALGSCVPTGFEFAEGDSIIGVFDFRIEYNIEPDNDLSPLLGDLYLSGDIMVFDEDTTMYDPLVCGCEFRQFELSGYRYSILPGQYALPGCELSEFVGGSVFSLTLHEGNFFPFEHRNLLEAIDWQVNIPAPTLATLVEARMTFLNYQGGVPILANVPLSWTGNNPYVFDFLEFQDPPLDEGFSALFQYIFDADCTIFGSHPIEFTATLDFDDGLPEDEDPLTFTSISNSLRGMVPNLSADAVNTSIISFDNQLVFDFSFANYPTEVAAQSSGAAPNTWMYVTSASGLVTDFQLIDPATGTPFPQTNGVFQLGNFPIDTIPLQLIGLNNSCELENLELHYGWNCDPFTSQVQTACYEQVLPLDLLSPPGEIDFLVESPTGCFDLCDTVDYHSIEIFNAELGAVYDLTLSGLLPQNLTVLPGSSEVEYPTGSGDFYPIGDPTVQGGGVVIWPLAELFDSLAMGLPGIGSAPRNSLTLRFLSSTDCDFVASAFSLFNISAEQVCGIPTNTVTKPSDPICINGVSSPYSAVINFETEPGYGCADIVEHVVSITATEDLPLGACVTVSLPQGVVYEIGSCEDICGTGMDCTPTFDGNSITWNLPEGVAAGQLICFGFTTSGWSGLDCGPGQILIRSTNETQAFCAATGMDCSVKVQTGAFIENFEIEKPEFELENFQISASQNGAVDVIDFSIDVINQSVVNEPPITLDFYLDTDGNGSGDDLVHTENVVAALSSGQSENVEGSFSIPSGNLCNLVAYVSPENQCACAIDSAYVTVPITYQTEQSPTVCSEEEIQIGVDAVSGFTYQWQPDNCLFDDQSASTIFSCANDGTAPETYEFTLSETDGGTCEINNLISVTVQPVPGIAFADSPICQGETANIAATNGVSFAWTGPDVVQNQQFQTVMPAVTSTYSVTVTDSEGCSGSESVEIIVNPNPTADAGPDIEVCPGETAQLNAPNVPSLEYLWSPTIVSGSPALSNPTVPNPIVLTNQSTTFTLEVTDENGCSSTDVAVVDFNGNIDLVVPADLTICLGSSATLTASGADNYVWTPSGDCLDPPTCSTIEVMPTVTTTYTVEASTVDGCTGIDEVTVTVSETEILVPLEDVEICEGETAIIFDTEVSVPGTYFDTVIVAGSDCDTIFSQNLFFFQPIDTTTFIGSFCEGEPFIFDGIEVSGDTCITYPSSISGCDSVVCLEIFVIPTIDDTIITDTICQGESVEFQQIEVFTDTCFVLTSSVTGCDSIVCLELTVLDTPIVELSIVFPENDTTIFEPGTEITLSIEPSTFDSIIWMGGGIGDECTNLPECTDILGETDTTYTVTVFDGLCFGSDALDLTVAFECYPEEALIPNVFTPNDDMVNDEFTIVSRHLEQVNRMEIWNRWGEKVYDGPGSWDGTQNGEPAISDVYIYVIEVGCPVQVEDFEERIFKGDVTLLR